MMRIYVGNLNYSTDEDALRVLFERYGDVEKVALIRDRDNGRSRGYAFVEMTEDREGRIAVDSLQTESLEGRRLTVNIARPRQKKDEDLHS